MKDIICRFKDDEDLLKSSNKGIVLKLPNIKRSTNFKLGESKENMWNKILICSNDTNFPKTFKQLIQQEIMESTTSTFVFSVAMMIVKKMLVLEDNFTKGQEKLMLMTNFPEMNRR